MNGTPGFRVNRVRRTPEYCKLKPLVTRCFVLYKLITVFATGCAKPILFPLFSSLNVVTSPVSVLIVRQKFELYSFTYKNPESGSKAQKTVLPSVFIT